MHHKEINQTWHIFKSKRKCLFLFWQVHVHLFFRSPSVLTLGTFVRDDFGFSDNLFQYKKNLSNNIILNIGCNYIHMCAFSCVTAIWYSVNCIKNTIEIENTVHVLEFSLQIPKPSEKFVNYFRLLINKTELTMVHTHCWQLSLYLKPSVRLKHSVIQFQCN